MATNVASVALGLLAGFAGYFLAIMPFTVWILATYSQGKYWTKAFEELRSLSQALLALLLLTSLAVLVTGITLQVALVLAGAAAAVFVAQLATVLAQRTAHLRAPISPSVYSERAR